MSDELSEQLQIIHDNLMDLLETAGTDALWVHDPRGLLVFARNTADPEAINLVEPLKAALGLNPIDGTLQ